MALSATRNMTRLYSCQHTYVVVFRFSLSDCCRVSRPHMAPRKTLDTVSGEEETYTRKKGKTFPILTQQRATGYNCHISFNASLFYNREVKGFAILKAVKTTFFLAKKGLFGHLQYIVHRYFFSHKHIHRNSCETM